MKIYFLSSEPCALRLGGVFFGMTDRFERYAEISLKDNIFVEFLSEGNLPLCFFLTENLRFAPPEGCEVYLLADGIAVYARDFTPVDNSLRTIAQKRLENCLVTVFKQGRVQMSVETDENFFVVDLPPVFAFCTIELQDDFILLDGEKNGRRYIALFERLGKRLLFEEALSYSFTLGELSARLPLSDRLGRSADCVWHLEQGECRRVQCILRQRREEIESETEAEKAANAEKIAAELLPYAFFESVLIGAEYAAFLSDELAAKADQIAAFLGDFEGVTLTNEPSVCGLVRRKGERLFELAYYTAVVENGKIVDIKG